MRHEIRFSGFGGQGIILAAVILGRAAALYDGKYAVQTQVYGPEARGGASMSSVVIDDEPILYPEVSVPDTYVIMSREGFERYGAKAPKRAVMLIDSDMVEGRPGCTFYRDPGDIGGEEHPGEGHRGKHRHARGPGRGDRHRLRSGHREGGPR